MKACLLLCLSSAFASPFFDSISNEIDLGMGGTWAIPIYHNDRWMLTMGQAGDLLAAPFHDDSWTVDMTQVMYLTQRGDLSDHSLRRCPSGGYLHVASSTVDGANFIHRYDAQFNLLSSGEIGQSQPPHASNDAPAICGRSFQGVGVAEATGLRDYFYTIDDQSKASIPIELNSSPRMTGAGLMEADEQLFVAGRNAGPEIHISSYDRTLALQQQWILPVATEGIQHYWPSRFLQVGEFYLLVTMGRDPSLPWNMDTGDLYLAVLDTQFEVLEWLQLSTNNPLQSGGMRPWMEHHDQTLLIGYDKQTSLHLFVLQLNADAFGLDVDQSSSDAVLESPGNNQPSSSQPNLDSSDGCGGSKALLLFPLFMAIRQRKNRDFFSQRR